MTEVLERLARERADYLSRESTTLTGEAEGFLVFARDNCNYVDFLLFVWQVMELRLHQGGVPAKRFAQECDLVLTLIAAPNDFLTHIRRVWHERNLPDQLAGAILNEVELAHERVNSLVQKITTVRDRVAAAPHGVSADPAILEQRIKKADENREWLPLRAAK